MRGRLFTATAGALCILTALQAWSMLRAPAAWLPASIHIRLAPSETITLGAHDLAAPQAERAHLQLRRDGQGNWLLRNLSPSRPVVLQDSGGNERRMGSAALDGRQRFQIGGTLFDAHTAHGAVAFRAAGSDWRYDGATLYRDGSAQPDCQDTHAATRMAALWNRAAPQALTVARPLSFGGNLHCGNRLGLPGVSPGAALLARSGAQLALSGGSQDELHTALRIGDAGAQTDLRQEERPLAGMTAFSIGRTRFQLGQPGAAGAREDGIGANGPAAGNRQTGVLTLTPGRHVALFAAPEARPAPQVTWHWRQRVLWDFGGAPVVAALLAIAVAGLAVAAVARRPAPAQGADATGSGGMDKRSRAAGRSGRPGAIIASAFAVFLRPGSGLTNMAARLSARLAAAGTVANAAAALALLAAGVAAILTQRAGHPASAACSLLLGAAGLALWLLTPRRLPLPVAAALVLLAAGLLAQLELGLGAGASSWLRYYQKSAALLAIGSGAGALCHVWQRAARPAAVQQRGIEWLLALFALAALAALAAQVLWGDETGVFDLQPVELAKLALTALTAHCLALRMGWDHGADGDISHLRRLGRQGLALRWLQLAAPALLFLTLLGFALIQVDDFSPLILLLVWSMAMAFAYALAARRRALALALAGVALAAVASIATVRGAGADGMAQLTGGFYTDRFQVWLAPAVHPHTGQQLLLGARAIADGGWWGADSMLGLRSLGLPAGAAVNIPAVQDDFAPSFFLNRHGLLGALLLWSAQAALVAGILRVAGRAHAGAALARDFRQAWLGRFRYFALCGGAAFVAGHLLLSWGTNLAIFPIMGQPMSFLSAGGSHLLFFLCPLLAFCAVSAQSIEEKEHAHLRPT